MLKRNKFGIKAEKIGVLAPNKRFFGAQIVTLPFYYNLKKIFSNADITVISPRPEAKIITGLNMAQKLIINNITAGSFINIVKLIKKEKFDILFTLRDN